VSFDLPRWLPMTTARVLSVWSSGFYGMIAALLYHNDYTMTAWLRHHNSMMDNYACFSIYYLQRAVDARLCLHAMEEPMKPERL
jgi:hypothetical protein